MPRRHEGTKKKKKFFHCVINADGFPELPHGFSLWIQRVFAWALAQSLFFSFNVQRELIKRKFWPKAQWEIVLINISKAGGNSKESIEEYI